jgi:uncharacterized membrane protein YkvA (DUF1232 family)
LKQWRTVPNDFDGGSFWTKVRNFTLVAGCEVIEKTLGLYYAAQALETRLWPKRATYTALAYFVMPFDAISGLIPVVGYTDYLRTLAAAVATVPIVLRRM